jgi:hypothetical protein
MKTFKIETCSCGCGKSYPVGKSKPAGWKQEGNSVIRLSDNVKFSKGDIIQRFTEQGKQYCDMIISDIDFYYKGKDSNLRDTFYIRAKIVENADIPEYVKCIKQIYENDNPKIGQIIKADINGNLHGICMYNSITYKDNFIPSTKEEYDAQFVKKDYEILSFKVNTCKYTLKDSQNVYSNGIFSYTLEKILFYLTAVNNPSVIHSVKRLSDGEIFTVGVLGTTYYFRWMGK